MKALADNDVSLDAAGKWKVTGGRLGEKTLEEKSGAVSKTAVSYVTSSGVACLDTENADVVISYQEAEGNKNQRVLINCRDVEDLCQLGLPYYCYDTYCGGR